MALFKKITSSFAIISILLAIYCAFMPPNTAQAAQAKQVCLLPIGKFDKNRIPIISRGIRYLYGFETKQLSEVAMPTSAWYGARQRWRADVILNWMDTNKTLWQNANASCTYMMAVTSEDISTTQPNYADWGIMGLGKLGGRVAISASFRLHRAVVKPNNVNRRLVKIVNHEIGHMLGVPHIKEANCLMQAAEASIQRIDQEHGLLCPATEHWIEEQHHITLPKHSTFDWSQVE